MLLSPPRRNSRLAAAAAAEPARLNVAPLNHSPTFLSSRLACRAFRAFLSSPPTLFICCLHFHRIHWRFIFFALKCFYKLKSSHRAASKDDWPESFQAHLLLITKGFLTYPAKDSASSCYLCLLYTQKSVKEWLHAAQHICIADDWNYIYAAQLLYRAKDWLKPAQPLYS